MKIWRIVFYYVFPLFFVALAIAGVSDRGVAWVALVVACAALGGVFYLHEKDTAYVYRYWSTGSNTHAELKPYMEEDNEIREDGAK